MSRTNSKLNDVTRLIKRPHVTEKSSVLSSGTPGLSAGRQVYTFVVDNSATKPTIKQAIKALYKVTPLRVAVMNVSQKTVFVRGKRGVKPGFKKALVYLKKGDKIDFV